MLRIDVYEFFKIFHPLVFAFSYNPTSRDHRFHPPEGFGGLCRKAFAVRQSSVADSFTPCTLQLLRNRQLQILGKCLHK
ncbi:MAG: hypothetical protein GWP06_18630 [Actinobacteria bacterium]|nr:hypothetical protein [Actinomycetota bacterium]